LKKLPNSFPVNNYQPNNKKDHSWKKMYQIGKKYKLCCCMLMCFKGRRIGTMIIWMRMCNDRAICQLMAMGIEKAAKRMKSNHDNQGDSDQLVGYVT
jgi:hypothetical protein